MTLKQQCIPYLGPFLWQIWLLSPSNFLVCFLLLRYYLLSAGSINLRGRMSVDPETFKISFLVADMISGKFDGLRLPDLTAEEIEQLRRHLQREQSRDNDRRDFSPGESLQLICRLNHGMTRLGELENPDNSNQNPVANSASEILENNDHESAPGGTPVKEVLEEWEDTESLYEAASQKADDSPAGQGRTSEAIHGDSSNHPDPVLQLLEKACIVLRTRVESPTASAGHATPVQLPHEPEVTNTITNSSVATSVSKRIQRTVVVLDGKWSKSSVCILLLILWCLWATWARRLDSFWLLIAKLQQFTADIGDKFLSIVDGMIEGYLTWRSGMV